MRACDSRPEGGLIFNEGMSNLNAKSLDENAAGCPAPIIEDELKGSRTGEKENI